MISLEVNDAVVLDQQHVLEAALSTNPKTQKALQGLIRRVVMQARSEVVSATRRALKTDPRMSARAIRTAVYKKILGANINIYNSRKAHGSTSYEPPRHPSHRGGNRMIRSSRTQQIMDYAPQDRGFILRWINTGTNPRYAAGRNGKWDKNGDNKTFFALQEQGDNYRGAIAPRNFFKGAGEVALTRAADALANMIDTELDSILNKKK